MKLLAAENAATAVSISSSIMLACSIYIVLKNRKSKNNTKFKNEYEQAPHWNWTHPYKSTLDKILSSIFPIILPLSDVTQSPLYISEEQNNTPELTKKLTSLRNSLKTMNASSYTARCKEWNSLLSEDNPILSGTVTIPTNNKILSEFGFTSLNGSPIDHMLQNAFNNKDEDDNLIQIDITCPQSAIVSGISYESKDSITSTSLENIIFDQSAHLLLWFHGGGLILGDGRDADCSIDNALRLTRLQNGTKSEKNACTNIVVLSVNYRLAPEYPFPAAIIDGLSAYNLLHTHFFSHSKHIGGISAGGNLSSVIGLESCRRYGIHNLKSIMIDSPMTQPNCQTLSYHLNSTSSGACPVDFLRWSWCAYLGLKAEKNQFDEADCVANAIQQSVWRDIQKNDLWRLICPQVDVPHISSSPKNSSFLKIIVCTSKADPLHDDGVQLFQALERQNLNNRHCSIQQYDFNGSHCLASISDATGKDKFLKEWSSMFGR